MNVIVTATLVEWTSSYASVRVGARVGNLTLRGRALVPLGALVAFLLLLNADLRKVKIVEL